MRSVAPLPRWSTAGRNAAVWSSSEIDEFVQALDLEENDLGGLYEHLDARGVAPRDDCGREQAPAAPVDDAALAHVTTDTPQLFLNEIGRHRLLAPEEIELARRIERGDLVAKELRDQRQPAPGRLDRQEVPGPS